MILRGRFAPKRGRFGKEEEFQDLTPQKASIKGTQFAASDKEEPYGGEHPRDPLGNSSIEIAKSRLKGTMEHWANIQAHKKEIDKGSGQ